ncbi:hypothetical protein NLC27_03100, partial [Candidatus Aminicenantes bacterium AC-708-I09]|nr:hypothetical protein [Candidatus Aminicenantes bacterium AC-708-I09]
LLIFPLFILLHLFIFYLQGFYKIKVKRNKLDEFFVVFINLVLTIVIVVGILSYLHAYSSGPKPLFRIDFQISHLFLVIYFIFFITFVLIFRSQVHLFLKRSYEKGHNLRKVLIIGAGEQGRSIAKKLVQYQTLGYKIIGYLDNNKKLGENVIDNLKVIGKINDLNSLLEEENINEIFITLPLEEAKEIINVIKTANNYIVNVRLVPDLLQYITLRSSIEDLDGIPIININDVPLQGWRSVVKRIMDIVISFIALIITSPLFFNNIDFNKAHIKRSNFLQSGKGWNGWKTLHDAQIQNNGP